MVTGSVYQAFSRTAQRFPGHDFLCVPSDTSRHSGIEPTTYSYARAAEEIGRLAARYGDSGVGLGQRVGLMLENRPDMFFHWLALNSLGASVVPINMDWREAELQYVIDHSELAAMIAPVARHPEIARASSLAQRSVTVCSPTLQELSTAIADGRRGRPDQHSECALLYTSGTTGRPKGCVLTNEYFLWAGDWYSQLTGVCRLQEGSERLVTPLPMTHMNAMAFSTMAMIVIGGCIVPLDRFHPRSWWDSVREARATVIHYLGVMPAMLLGAAPNGQDRNHSVRFGFGAGVSTRLHEPFESRFGFPLIEAWAMTETGAGAVVIANREPRKIGSACFGRPSDLVSLRIVDEHGNDAAVGQHGELRVRSSLPRPTFGFFREYLKDPAATAAAWEGGYFRTGDIVYADAEGDLHFVDRKKNVIRRSGENISAVEVEAVILQHPAIASVGVAAVPDAVRGDEVMACVVLRLPLAEAMRLDFAIDLVDFCLQRLAYFKAPGYVSFVDQLPLTATEKIQRGQLGELARAGLETAVDVRDRKKRDRTT